ncbi:MAG: hypothetical protein MUF64_12590, partial [Polyangiaceae bacterium]|nr:hypothetical protein [Polyangiaceae bacterium]
MRAFLSSAALVCMVACSSSEETQGGAAGAGATNLSGQGGEAGAGGSGVAGAGQGGASGSSGQGGVGGMSGSSGQGGAGGSSGSSGQGGAAGMGQGGSSGVSGQGGAAGAGQGGASGSSGQGGGALGGAFRYGINTGFFTAKVADADSAALAVKAGANSMRAKLSEQHLTTWGDEIEVNDMKAYQALGMTDLVAFLGGPIAEHSNAPAGKAPWELEQYSPKNLYEPIFLPSGEVNPANHWASFVARVAKTYGPWLKVYEIWNEPDQVG